MYMNGSQVGDGWRNDEFHTDRPYRRVGVCDGIQGTVFGVGPVVAAMVALFVKEMREDLLEARFAVESVPGIP